MDARVAASALLVTGLVVAGCGGPSAPPPPTPTPSPEVSGAITEVVPPDLATGVVPHALDRMQEDTNELFAAVPDHDWARVQELVSGIERSWSEWLATSDATEVPEGLKDAVDLRLQDLKDTAKERFDAPILRAANNLQMAVLFVVEVYRPALPTAVGRLQVAERNILLDIASGDKVALSETVTEAAAIWQDLEITVQDAGGEQIATDFGALLDRQQKALDDDDMTALKKEAAAAEGLIDRMQALFT